MAITPPCPSDRGFGVFLVVTSIHTRIFSGTWHHKKRWKAYIHFGSRTEQKGIQSGWKMKKEKMKSAGLQEGVFMPAPQALCKSSGMNVHRAGLEGGHSQESSPWGKIFLTAVLGASSRYMTTEAKDIPPPPNTPCKGLQDSQSTPNVFSALNHYPATPNM